MDGATEEIAPAPPPGSEAPRRWLPLWRPRNVWRLFVRAVKSFRPQPEIEGAVAHRLKRAERRGLQFAILCRTVAYVVALVFYVVSTLLSNGAPTPAGIALFAAFIAIGVGHFILIGTRFDRRWFAYAAAAIDILAICALMAFVPAERNADLPLIYNFRTFGIYMLFPFVALAALSLSPRLVLWAGFVAVVGWWAAFVWVVAPMETRLSWSDVFAVETVEQYEAIVMSPHFIGTGTRMVETLVLAISALILALAVAKARRLFFAQVRAEVEREAERAQRARLTLQLGRYVPPTIARRLIDDPSGLVPQVRHGAVLVADIENFTAFANERAPAEVIAELNGFLAEAADVVGEAGGVVISFTGDGLLATFNTPLDVPQPERTALGVTGRLVACGRRFGFRVRCGVAAGEIAAGSVGSSSRQAFTVYGDTVNRAARLEALAKELGETVLVDTAVAAAAGGGTTPLGSFVLRGIAGAVPVFAAAVAEETS